MEGPQNPGYRTTTCVCVLSHFSRVRLSATLQTVVLQAPLSMGFSRQDNCSGLPCSPSRGSSWPRDRTHGSYFPALAAGFFTTRATWEAPDADIENKLVVTSGKREVQRSMIRIGDLEVQIIRHKMSYTHILYNTGNIANYFMKTILFVIFALSHYVMSDSFPASWIVACQACLSMEFSRQEYWSGLPFPTSGDLPNPGIKLLSPALAGRLPLSQQRNPIITTKGEYTLKIVTFYIVHL